MSNVCGRCKRPMSSHDDHAFALNVELRLASATLMFTTPVPSVGDGRPSNGVSLEGLW